jgi:hypothetical protein
VADLIGGLELDTPLLRRLQQNRDVFMDVFKDERDKGDFVSFAVAFSMDNTHLFDDGALARLSSTYKVIESRVDKQPAERHRVLYEKRTKEQKLDFLAKFLAVSAEFVFN